MDGTQRLSESVSSYAIYDVNYRFMSSLEEQTSVAQEVVRQLTFDEVSAELVEALGVKLAAFALNVEGDSLASAPNESEMRDLLVLVLFLRQLDGDEVARAWLIGMNPMLNDDAPISVIANGHIDAAWTAARAHATLG